jgi:type II secretion system protein I
VKKESGFTLLEVLVAMTIFSLAAVGMAQAFVTHLKANNTSEIRSQATHAAQLVLDQLRTVDPALLPSTGNGSAETVAVNNRAFSVVVQYCADSSLCPSSSTRHLRAKVSYRNAEVYRVDTVFTQLR